MTATIQPDVISMIRADWMGAPRGAKTGIIKEWAERLNCSAQKIYRAIETGRKRVRGQRKIQGIEAAAFKVAAIKKMAPEHKGEIATEDALKIAADAGIIPEDLADKRPTVDRVMRELGLNRKKRRIQRFQAERPNQMHHVDASSSDCFYIDRFEDGEPILKLHRGHKIYKNKPVPTRFRPWIYGLTDDHSGVHIARYVAAQGESALDNLDFMVWAWAKNEDKKLFGIPEKLKGDLGPMMRGPEAKDFFARLGIEIDPSTPLNKEAHGKIERPWRTMWQRFERPFFVEDMKAFEITMSGLNERFYRYLARYNRKPHRFERRVKRIDMWKKINRQGGAVAISENALSTVARRIERTVDQAGILWLDGNAYEVRGLHDAKVYVFQGIADGRLVVQDRRTGEKHEVETFSPNPLGTFKSPPDSAHIKAVKAGDDLKEETRLHNTLYNKVEDLPENVTPFPVRVKETVEPENPMEISDSYISLEAAMKDFCAMTGLFLAEGSEDRAAVEGVILDSGLSREYVRSFALEVAEEDERTVAV